MANKQELLTNAITDAGLRDYSYDQIKEYYQDKYGQRHWISEYSKAIAKDTGGNYRSIARSIQRFDSGQYKSSKYTTDTNATKISRQEVLPSLRDTVSLTMQGKQSDIRGGTMTEGDRTIKLTVQFSGDNPTWEDVWNDYEWDYDIAEDSEYQFSAYSVVAA